MCAKNHLLIFSSFLDIWENVEWPRFFWTTLYLQSTTEIVACYTATYGARCIKIDRGYVWLYYSQSDV